MIEYTFYKYDSIDSTNDEARRLINKGDLEQFPQEAGTAWGENAVVLADSQINGKGRLGRHWYSPPGNLYMTVVKRPQVPITQLSQISLVVGVAVRRVLEKFISPDHHLALKWPNDILINGMKIGGILVETDIPSTEAPPVCYIGIGINLLSSPDLINYPACSLLDFTKNVPTRDDFSRLLLASIETVFEDWTKSGFQEIREEWLWHAYGLGKPVQGIAENGFKLYGRLLTIDPEGALIISDEDGREHLVRSGEITYLS